MKGYYGSYEQIYAYKFNNLDEWTISLKDINYKNSYKEKIAWIAPKETESVIINLPKTEINRTKKLHQ